MVTDSPIDNLLVSVDRALRAVFTTPTATRPVPRPAGVPGANEATLSAAERRESASLMRVNHAGEVAAQGLYNGQAIFARRPEVRDMLLRAAREEADHLAWCDQRLHELGSRPSVLGPFWYAGSFAIGAAAAA
ncbi:MAG: demethoxyubiquinone hydroxylase family protein, partial [Gammaproteobacteria bacterium]|nr:demethoxyubiquinone hydroxylase family protein [Gammaproteobacteria bacterium]